MDKAFSALIGVFPHAIGVMEGVGVLVGTGEGVGLGVVVGGSGVSVALGKLVGLGVGTVEVGASGEGVADIGAGVVVITGAALEQATNVRLVNMKYMNIFLIISPP